MMVAMAATSDRYPVQQAQLVIADRVADGSRVSEVRGLWVFDEDIRPDPDYLLEFSPDSSGDAEEINSRLESWPRDEAFCVEIVVIREV